MRRLVIISLCLLMLAMATSSSYADTGERSDPAEWSGDSYLDIALLRHDHRGAPNVLRHSMSMHEPWDDFDLEDGDSYIVFKFDYDRDRTADASAVVDYDMELGGLHAYLIHHRDGAERMYLEQPARPDTRTVSIVLGKKHLRRGLRRYRWKAEAWASSENDDNCAEPLHGPTVNQYSVCVDLAPGNRKWIRHAL